MKVFFCRLALAAGLAAAATTGAEAQNIAGTYNVVGDAGGGQRYTGSVVVRPAGQGWDVRWNVGGQASAGVGVLNNGVLSVGYVIEGKIGVAQYVMTPIGFDGVWITRGASVVLREAWSR